jgi:hypothetical protein
MHPTIGALVSELIYGARLVHAATPEACDSIARAAPIDGDALVVVDTAGHTR